ncbi:MAG: hypothetical protein LAO20_01435 [Acidobacteriia bacterium]|nr:hypothetical protein [Terriglobia bacterium]
MQRQGVLTIHAFSRPRQTIGGPAESLGHPPSIADLFYYETLFKTQHRNQLRVTSAILLPNLDILLAKLMYQLVALDRVSHRTSPNSKHLKFRHVAPFWLGTQKSIDEFIEWMVNLSAR